MPPSKWTRPADIEARVRKRFVSGALLAAHARREPFETISVPLKRPNTAGLAEHLREARKWATEIERGSADGSKYRVETSGVGGRDLGRTELPARAVIETYEQAWRLLGVGGAAGPVVRFAEVLRQSARVPAAEAWAFAHPIRAAELADEWPAVLEAYEWLSWSRGSGKYLREIDAPGVDTKFIERYLGVFAKMLDVPTSGAGFIAGLGLAAKPSFVRLRFDPRVFGMPTAITEAEFRVDELSQLAAEVTSALIIENEVSYLSVPVPEGGVVLWGKGYDVDNTASLAWLQPVASRGDVRYWGDIDTHGFAILNRVRSHLPGVRSVLMDRETLLAHEPRWGIEDKPVNVRLPGLTEAEGNLYTDLVTDRYASKLRLEQERIDWAWATRRLL